MKKFKKLTAAMIAGIMVLATAGCSSSSDAEPSASGETSSASTGGKKELNILMEQVPDTNCVIANLDKFTEETGIKVNVESITYDSMHEKLLTQMLSKTNTYDVIVVDCYWTGEFTTAGWLTDLGPYMEKTGFSTEPYVDSMMEMVGEVDGTTYMIPFYNYMMSLIYRTDVFEDEALKKGYEEQTGKEFKIPDNMDDYVELCKYITSTKGDELSGAVMMGLRPDPITIEFMNYFFSCGADFYDEEGNITVNSPEAVHALDLYVDNMNNTAPSGSPSFGFDEAFNVFAQGNAASFVSYNWMIPKLQNADESSVAGKVDITPMPGGVSLNAGWGWAIPHNAEDKDASWEFINWVESFEITKARALAGGSPTRSDVMSDPEVLEAWPYLKTVESIMQDSKIIPVIADAPQLVEVLGRELSEAVIGSKSSQEALDAVAEEMKNMK